MAQKICRYPLIVDDCDVEGLGMVIRGKLIKKLSVADFFVTFVLMHIPNNSPDENQIVEELVRAFAECKPGNEPCLREVAHATLLGTMNYIKDEKQMNPYVFLQARSIWGCISSAPTEPRPTPEREAKPAPSGDDTETPTP